MIDIKEFSEEEKRIICTSIELEEFNYVKQDYEDAEIIISDNSKSDYNILKYAGTVCSIFIRHVTRYLPKSWYTHHLEFPVKWDVAVEMRISSELDMLYNALKNIDGATGYESRSYSCHYIVHLAEMFNRVQSGEARQRAFKYIYDEVNDMATDIYHAYELLM